MHLEGQNARYSWMAQSAAIFTLKRTPVNIELNIELEDLALNKTFLH